ncbi:MAG: ferritin [Armatimonadota bacterium]|nr:ferritin [Armatimonadota bacterium]
MLSQRMLDALNKQINAEMYSGYLYLSMSAYYQSIGLPGFANWFFVQNQEEQAHAQIIYNHVIDRGGRVILKAIDAPPTDWSGPIAPVEDALKHEQKVTAMINDLVNLALEEKDFAANAMLQWFVTEQVEEEKNPADILQQLKLTGDAPGGLVIIDRELAARVFVPPAILTGGGAATAG